MTNHDRETTELDWATILLSMRTSSCQHLTSWSTCRLAEIAHAARFYTGRALRPVMSRSLSRSSSHGFVIASVIALAPGSPPGAGREHCGRGRHRRYGDAPLQPADIARLRRGLQHP